MLWLIKFKYHPNNGALNNFNFNQWLHWLLGVYERTVTLFRCCSLAGDVIAASVGGGPLTPSFLVCNHNLRARFLTTRSLEAVGIRYSTSIRHCDKVFFLVINSNTVSTLVVSFCHRFS